ncbi:septal ring lytic transglycosylase RlpA family lipoprotein [Methylobacterium radiotolerans]
MLLKARTYILTGIAATCILTAGTEVNAASDEQAGVASWYGPGFHGRKTANGERFDMNALTAAHRTLPLGTQVRVTNTHTGKSVVVRINDRGPYVGRRLIDLSKASAQAIGLSGLAKVSIARL